MRRGGLQNGTDRWIGPRQGGCPTCALAVWRWYSWSLSSFSAGASGVGVTAPLPVIVKDRQLAVLVAHVATAMRRLANAQQRGRQWWQKQRQHEGRQQST